MFNINSITQHKRLKNKLLQQDGSVQILKIINIIITIFKALTRYILILILLINCIYQYWTLTIQTCYNI